MNARFQEYVTSGTFTLTLSRNQVSALSLIANGEGRSLGISDSILERKGLVEPVAAPEARALDNIEFRPTVAGLLATEMLREAGLINFTGPNAVSNELNALRAEIAARRMEAAISREKMISALARKDVAETDLAEALAKIARLETCVGALESGLTLRRGSMLDEVNCPSHTKPRVHLRDTLPGQSDEQLRGSS